jgi:hypothetical protein
MMHIVGRNISFLSILFHKITYGAVFNDVDNYRGFKLQSDNVRMIKEKNNHMQESIKKCGINCCI